MVKQGQNLRVTNLKRVATAVLLALIGLVVYFYAYGYTHQAKLESELNATKTQLEQSNLNSNLKEQEAQNLKNKIKQLEADLQAKKDEKLRIASLQQKTAQASSVRAIAPTSGSCAEWMAQAGIPLTTATQQLILRESGCRYNAINPSSGACGIPQAYPCSKLPCSLDASGAVCQLSWMDNYVKSRYGSWENAYSTWLSRYPHWY